MALPGTIDIYITDKNGGKHWNTNVGAAYASGERHNLQRHLAMIKSGHKAYANVNVDRETARIVVEVSGDPGIDLSPEAIMTWLAE